MFLFRRLVLAGFCDSSSSESDNAKVREEVRRNGFLTRRRRRRTFFSFAMQLPSPLRSLGRSCSEADSFRNGFFMRPRRLLPRALGSLLLLSLVKDLLCSLDGAAVVAAVAVWFLRPGCGGSLVVKSLAGCNNSSVVGSESILCSCPDDDTNASPWAWSCVARFSIIVQVGA